MIKRMIKWTIQIALYIIGFVVCDGTGWKELILAICILLGYVIGTEYND